MSVPRFRKGLQPTHRHGIATIKSAIQESKEMEQEKERETCVANFKLLVQRFRKGLQPPYRRGIVAIKSVSPESKEMEQEREREVGRNEEGVVDDLEKIQLPTIIIETCGANFKL
jgi:hypothetical protein